MPPDDAIRPVLPQTDLAATPTLPITPNAPVAPDGADVAPGAVTAGDAAEASGVLSTAARQVEALVAFDQATEIPVLLAKLPWTLSLLEVEMAYVVLHGVAKNPKLFARSFYDAFSGELLDVIRVPVRVLVGAVAWSAQAIGCQAMTVGRGWAEMTWPLDVGPIPGGDVETALCRPTREFADSVREFEFMLDDFSASIGAIYRNPLGALVTQLELLDIGIEVLLPEMMPGGRLNSVVMKYADDPEKTGHVFGVIAAQVALMIVPGKVAAPVSEALASAGKFVKLDAFDALQIARIEKTVAETGETKQVWVGRAVPDNDATAAKFAVKELNPGEEGALVRAIVLRLRAEYRQIGKRLSGRITGDRLSVFRKIEAFNNFHVDLLARAQERVYTCIVRIRGTNDSVKALRSAVEGFNAHSEVVFLLDAETSGALADTSAATLLDLNMTLSEKLVDIAHLTDERFFPYFSKEALDVLAWTSEDDMPGVIVAASEHRRSWPGWMAKLAGEKGAMPLPAELNEFDSITHDFRTQLIKADAKGVPLPGELKPAPGAVFIRPDMKASEIIEKHLQVWSKEKYSAPGGVASRGGIERLQALIEKLRDKGL